MWSSSSVCSCSASLSCVHVLPSKIEISARSPQEAHVCDASQVALRVQRRSSGTLVKTLIVLRCAHFPRISPRDENKIRGCQRKTHRPPNESKSERVRARRDGIGS